MVTKAENERLTRVEGDAPMGRMIRENYWVPFALSSHLTSGDAPMPVRLLGENYVAFRGENGAIGFFDELCPHRRASLTLARVEGDGMRCIYHGWKIDVGGCVVDAPTQTVQGRAVRQGRPGRCTSRCGRRAVWRGCGSAAPRRRRSPSSHSRARWRTTRG
jgi:phthalate 4,5-dioxygenase oxygenase subunit